MKELQIAAKTENLDTVFEFLDRELESCACNAKMQMQIRIAVEEIFTNISCYAYQETVGNATIQIETDKDAVTITIMDKGMPYNPLEKDDPDITLSAKERQIGGLGIFMAKNCMDHMEYAYRDESNILTLKKYLDTEKSN
ncbi:MAG: ATP-binding protein [Lachnospiraceae bacterium]|nr:ATP-binding protein [Lachnospiraceae bacterium]